MGYNVLKRNYKRSKDLIFAVFFSRFELPLRFSGAWLSKKWPLTFKSYCYFCSIASASSRLFNGAVSTTTISLSCKLQCLFIHSRLVSKLLLCFLFELYGFARVKFSLTRKSWQVPFFSFGSISLPYAQEDEKTFGCCCDQTQVL